MSSALDSEARGSALSPGRGHCVVFLGETLHSYSASPPRCVNESRGGGNPAMD